MNKWWKDPNCATNWKKTKNVITIGTMFSGVESYVHALENTPIQHCFSIEHDPYCCKVIRNTLEPQLWVFPVLQQVLGVICHMVVACGVLKCITIRILMIEPAIILLPNIASVIHLIFLRQEITTI